MGENEEGICSAVRMNVARLYAFFVCYRFRKSITTLRIPGHYSCLQTEEIKGKARASLTSVSALLGFDVAVLVALAAWGRVHCLLRESASWRVLACAALGVLFPYGVFWFERYVSRASVEVESPDEKRRMRARGSLLVGLFLLLSLSLFFVCPKKWPSWYVIFERGFALSGCIMIALSTFFLFFALEFYDSASGWRGGRGLHFHLTSLASHSYVLGVSLVLAGLALSLCLLDFFVGRLIASSALLVLVASTEIQRHLWDLERAQDNRK
jgi:hypothetical protein